jgi:transcription initiation factor TFIID TATA-box-binding protein
MTADRVILAMGELLDFEYEPAVEISNIVATSDFRSPIPLELLTLELGMDAQE